jgi:hypothetical protein
MLQQQERGQSPESTGHCSCVSDQEVSVGDHIEGMTRGPAVLATVAALALVNLGLASLIASAVGARGFIPVWVAVVLLVLGVVAAGVAVTLWRGYLSTMRSPQ